MKAQLSISGIHKEKDVGAADKFAAFTISLAKGLAKLRTSLLDARGVGMWRLLRLRGTLVIFRF